MKVEIIVTETFEREFKRLLKKYPSLINDLSALQKDLTDNPETGSDLGGGYRKIRMAISSKNKGKSGGARIITFNLIVNVSEIDIFLLTIYDKSEKDTISMDAINRLKAKLDL